MASQPSGKTFERLSRLWDYLTKSIIYNATSHAIEAFSAWQLHRYVPNFLYAHESATYDAGLLSSKAEMSTDGADTFSDRLEHVREVHGSQKVVVPIDFKHINPLLSTNVLKGLYFFRFAVEASQRKCGVLIVRNPASPRLVACIPLSYLKSLRKRHKDRPTCYYTPEAPLTSSTTLPIPIGLSPFVLPAEHLVTSLELLLAFIHDEKETWSNPYNGIEFSDFKKPPLVSVDDLFVSETNSIHDQPVIQALRSACATVGSKYNVVFPVVKPCGGDLLVKDLDSGAMYLIELKLGAFGASESEPQQERSFTFARGTTPVVSFDALALVNRDQTEIVVIARDEVPARWLECRAGNDPDETYNFEMTQSFEFWEKRTIHLPHGIKQEQRSLGIQFGQILDFLHSQGLLPAKKPIPYDDTTRKRILDGEGYRRPIQDRVKRLKKNKRTARGSGRQRSPMLVDATRAMAINAQCRKSGFGNLFRLGTHPSATHVFCDGPYIGDTGSFYDLDLDTPMLYVNFIEVDHFACYHPNDNRAWMALIQSTHGRSRSVYVVRTRVKAGEIQPLVEYIVPSETLGTVGRKAIMDEYINGTQETFELNMFLSEGELLDCYRIRSADLCTGLQRVLHGCVQATARVKFGDGIKVTGNEYVTTRGEVMKEVLDVHLGRLPWKQGGRKSKTRVDDDEDSGDTEEDGESEESEEDGDDGNKGLMPEAE